MLHEFLTLHRDDIIARTRREGREPGWPRGRRKRSWSTACLSSSISSWRRCGSSRRPTRVRPATEMARGAALHGAELRAAGFTVAQVVHDYGDVCQAVTELAIELELPISADEFRPSTGASTRPSRRRSPSIARQRELSLSDRGTERLGFFAHELRNLLSNAHARLRGPEERDGRDRRQHGRRPRAQPGRAARPHRPFAGRGAARGRAPAPASTFSSPSSWKRSRWRRRSKPRPGASSSRSRRWSRGSSIDVDRQLLAAALANLLQNAFKFSRPSGHVVLRTDTRAPPPAGCSSRSRTSAAGFRRAGPKTCSARSSSAAPIGAGWASGSPSPARASRANGGEIRARSLPGRGCIFTIDLPSVDLASAKPSGARRRCPPLGPTSSRACSPSGTCPRRARR